jgi:GPR1/FUN34/yaaH family
VHRENVANPAPLGLFAFGLTTALLQGANTAITEKSTNFLVYAFAFFYGGLAQVRIDEFIVFFLENLPSDVQNENIALTLVVYLKQTASISAVFLSSRQRKHLADIFFSSTLTLNVSFPFCLVFCSCSLECGNSNDRIHSEPPHFRLSVRNPRLTHLHFVTKFTFSPSIVVSQAPFG